MLDYYGYRETQSVLDEWNYIPPGMDWGVVFNPKNPLEQKRISQQIAGTTAAAFDAAVLLYLQDCPVDIATYYLADAMPYFSMFDVYGVPLPPFYAFRAFKWLLETPWRVKAEGNDPDSGLAIGAGRDEVGSQANILISNENAAIEQAQLSISNIPWLMDTRVEVYLQDATHPLESIRVEQFKGSETQLRLPCRPGSVYLLKLTSLT